MNRVDRAGCQPRLRMQLISDPFFKTKISFRDVLIAGLPGCLVVVIYLSFFLPKAFTIDDPIFLRAAKQAAQTPLHPFAYDMCWENGKMHHFSRFVANAPLMGYLLMPAVFSKSPEIVSHFLQILLLTIAILTTASLALRFGLSRREATLVAALTATCPAVMGMAVTVMPDILAMVLAVITIERFVAWWQDRGRWGNAIIAGAALALAPLSRPQLLLLFPTCVLLGIPYASLDWLGKEWRRLIPAFAVVGVSAAAYYSIVIITRDPAARAIVFRPGLIEFSPHALIHHALSLGCYLALTTPFVLGVLVLLLRKPAWRISAIACLLPLVPLLIMGQSLWSVYSVSAVACLALGWSLLQLLKLRTGTAFALALWMVFPFSVIVYLHMAAKYLVPSAPAYSLVLVLLFSSTEIPRNWILRTLSAAGLILGSLIVSAENREANMARFAVEKWTASVERGAGRILFLGQWGFQWYAELHQAACFNPQSADSAQPGDHVIVDLVSGVPFPKALYPNSRLVDVIAGSTPGGVLGYREKNVGFYSDTVGRWPWYWAPGDAVRFELWEIH
jgi:hypothetical protein